MTSYCGINATQMWDDLYLWEQLLNNNANTECIIELGTAYGGFSLFLMHQAEARGMKFYTFDNIDHVNDSIEQHFGQPSAQMVVADLEGCFQKLDILTNPGIQTVKDTINQYEKIILFCDNGLKKKEVELYGPSLKEGSLCVVHDWGTEIHLIDIPEYLDPYQIEYSNESMTRVFIKQ